MAYLTHHDDIRLAESKEVAGQVERVKSWAPRESWLVKQGWECSAHRLSWLCQLHVGIQGAGISNSHCYQNWRRHPCTLLLSPKVPLWRLFPLQ